MRRAPDGGPSMQKHT